jgi:transcriptional regulator with XRE-family HTH domain
MNKRNDPSQCDTRTIAGRFRLARQAKHWTQEELARRAHTTQAQIQKIENGKSLRPRNIECIADLLGVNLAWLMFGESRSEVDDEGMQIADMWSQLEEPDRSFIRRLISRRVHKPKEETRQKETVQNVSMLRN